jgi:ABC-type glycerol-3-phosphate transport system permease component
MIKLFSHRFRLYNFIAWFFLIIVIFFWMYPFIWLIFASFKLPLDLFKSGASLLPKVWTVENYQRAWVQAHFSSYFFNSTFYSVSATSLSVLIAGMSGYVLARYQFPGSKLLYGMILAMLFLPVAASAVPVFTLMKNLKLLNTPYSVILAMTGGGGFTVLLFVGYFKNIPQDMYDAAIVDGANFVQQFMLVLPLAKPIIATTVIFTFMSAWNDFFMPLIFTLSTPKLRTLAVGLRAFYGEFSFDWSGFAAATVISVMPIILVFILFQDYFVNGLSGAVKG